HRHGRPLLTDGSARAEKRQINASKRLGGNGLDGHLFVAEAQLRPRAAGGCQQAQLAHGKAAFPEQFQQFGADGARGAQDGDVESFHVSSSIAERLRARPRRQRTGRRFRWISIGCSCRPSSAAATVSVIKLNSATHDVGLASGLSWPKGTKYICFRII